MGFNIQLLPSMQGFQIYGIYGIYGTLHLQLHVAPRLVAC